MIRPLMIVILLILLNFSGSSQTFLDAYKKFQLDRADTLSNLKTRKKIKSFVKSQLVELDTVFRAYKAKTKFDFNTADTLFLIYQASAESPFFSEVIIWSGKDTISYEQGFYNFKRGITYKPFLPVIEKLKGIKVVTERDSLLTLVSRRDFETINQLGDNQSIIDGSYVNIYVAYKDNKKYKIESCSPRQFIIWTTYRKE
jgi:hypothetical protein